MTSRSVSYTSFALLVVSMLIISGCIGPLFEDMDDNSPETAVTDDRSNQTTSENPISTATFTDSATPTATAAPTATSTPATPGRESTLTVAIKDTKGETRTLTPEIREALDYWEQNSEQYAGYPIEFVIEPDAENPDILISYVSAVEECGNIDYPEKYLAGCTRSDGERVLVELETDYTDESMVDLIIHEFGHVLGLGHDDAPQEYMGPQQNLEKPPSPDATERELPWNHSTLTVGMDLSNVSPDERSAVKNQIEKTLAYYDSGADGSVPESVSFRLGENPDTADISIQFSENSPCSSVDQRGSGSCHTKYGYDPDRDDEFEYYGNITIVLTNLDAENVEQHVGHQLGYGFGFSEPDDWPERFQPRS